MSTNELTCSSSNDNKVNKNRKFSVFLSKKTNSIAKKNQNAALNYQNCIFCLKVTSKGNPITFPQMIKKALYFKYSSSQNYYYSRDINDILTNSKNPKVIRFKDFQHYDKVEEYLKRFYKINEHNAKIEMLTEYYKFHHDLPRIFLKPVSNILNHHHHNKRNLEYIRITKTLRETKTKNSLPKQIASPQKQAQDILVIEKVLDELSIAKSVSKNLEPFLIQEAQLSNQVLNPNMKEKTVKFDNKHLKSKDSTNLVIKIEDNFKEPERSASNTLHELNLKLGEIISRSYSQITDFDLLNHFDLETQKPDHNYSNLDIFLKFNQPNPENFDFVPTIVSLSIKASKEKIDQEENIQAKNYIKPSYKLQADAYPSNKIKYKKPHLEKEKDYFKNDHIASFSLNQQKKTKILKSDESKKKSYDTEMNISSLKMEKPIRSICNIVATKALNIPSFISKDPECQEFNHYKKQKVLFQINSHRNESGTTSKQGVILQEYEKSRAISSLRRRRLKTEDSSKSNIKANEKNTSINVNDDILEETVEALNLTSHNMKIESKTQKEITLPIKHIGKNKEINQSSNTKRSSDNFSINNMNIFSQKAISSHLIAQCANKNSFLAKSEHSNIQNKGLSTGISKYQKDEHKQHISSQDNLSLNNRNFLSASENILNNIKNNTANFYKKTIKQRDIKNFIKYSLTRSQEKLSKLDIALSKKESIPKIDDHKTFHTKNKERLIHQEPRSLTPEKIFNYNNSNLINIYMQPLETKRDNSHSLRQNETHKIQAGSIELRERPIIKILNKKISFEDYIPKYNQSHLKRSGSNSSERKRRGAESPLRVFNKDDSRIIKSRSIIPYLNLINQIGGVIYSNIGEQSNIPLRHRDICL